ncbi:hypothetical protein DFQ27_006736 [Actinomortierella ambigua]|uniref:Complex 1 LYR protein domain-containing protein n=1 Tax=Actinomortierella ambigua TaxID=1343610 RepID=A0A9P6PVJ6_9FUNG|nr:hypothetical protein DFQ27_006736 [Actinomortierella ambigua]
MSTPAASTTRAQTLSLYRRLIRIGKAMPTENRSRLVLARVRGDFREHLTETDPDEIQSLIQLAELQADNLEIQKNHLTELSKNPNLFIPVDIYKDAKPKVSRFMKGAPLSWERKAAQEKKAQQGATPGRVVHHVADPKKEEEEEETMTHFDKASRPRATHSCKNHDHTHRH